MQKSYMSYMTFLQEQCESEKLVLHVLSDNELYEAQMQFYQVYLKCDSAQDDVESMLELDYTMDMSPQCSPNNSDTTIDVSSIELLYQ